MTILLIIAWLLLLLLGICLYCFITCFYSANKTPLDPYANLHGNQYQAVKDKIFEITRAMDAVPFERVSITSVDGIPLSGRYYHLRDGAPIKIIFHGYRSMALRDSAGGFGMARKLGMNVLAVDQRAHGNSGGHVITFGVMERHDCLSWIQYVNSRFGADVPIVLSGLSMGAATVIMATALPLPENVVCVLADCPYSSPDAIIRKVCRDNHYPDYIIQPFIKLAALIFGRFNLDGADAVKAAAVSKIPILLLHGEDDRFVPCEMSRKIHENSNGCTQLFTFPTAGHGLCYMIEPSRYEKICFDFLLHIPQLRNNLLLNEEATT